MITIQRIREEVAARFDTTLEQMDSTKKIPAVNNARCVAIYLCVMARFKPDEIGAAFGGRSEYSINYSVKALQSWLDTERALAEKVETLRLELGIEKKTLAA